MMIRRRFAALPLVLCAASLCAAARQAGTDDNRKALEALRRVDGSTPRPLQIALALAAGPAVSGAADLYVLGPAGYVRARKGTNGFSCLVERQRPDTVEPECYDAEGTATTLKIRLFIEAERARGTSETDIARQVDLGYKNGRFLAPRKAGIVYMMSDYNYVFDPEGGKVIHFSPHLMFYAPYATAKDVGKGPGAPYLVSPGRPDALMIVVPASHAHSER